MRLFVLASMTAVFALCSFATPVAAQTTVSTYTEYGPTRTDACSAAKRYAGYSAAQNYTIVRFSPCDCSDRGGEANRNQRWVCSVDATLRRND
jgi:hypothetical protein